MAARWGIRVWLHRIEEAVVEVKQAVATAKTYVKDLYEPDETISNLGLEEVDYDPGKDEWKITVGFSRPWKRPRTQAAAILERMGEGTSQRRSYKVVTIANDGKVLSMKDREPALDG